MAFLSSSAVPILLAAAAWACVLLPDGIDGGGLFSIVSAGGQVILLTLQWLNQQYWPYCQVTTEKKLKG